MVDRTEPTREPACVKSCRYCAAPWVRNGSAPAVSMSGWGAASLYRGGFLSGFYTTDSVAFENWQMLVQEELRQKQMSVLQRLMEIHGAAAQYEQAIEYARRRLGLDPLDEEAHRQLMRFHSLAGQHLEALRQYERCRLMLQRELGEKPEEDTERLREQITTRRLPAGAPPGE